MREHQVLTGTANLGDSTVSIGYIDGIAIVVSHYLIRMGSSCGVT